MNCAITTLEREHSITLTLNFLPRSMRAHFPEFDALEHSPIKPLKVFYFLIALIEHFGSQIPFIYYVYIIRAKRFNSFHNYNYYLSDDVSYKHRQYLQAPKIVSTNTTEIERNLLQCKNFYIVCLHKIPTLKDLFCLFFLFVQFLWQNPYWIFRIQKNNDNPLMDPKSIYIYTTFIIILHWVSISAGETSVKKYLVLYLLTQLVLCECNATVPMHHFRIASTCVPNCSHASISYCITSTCIVFYYYITQNVFAHDITSVPEYQKCVCTWDIRAVHCLSKCMSSWVYSRTTKFLNKNLLEHWYSKSNSINISICSVTETSIGHRELAS